MVDKDELQKEIKQTAPDVIEDVSDETLNRIISDAKNVAILDNLPETITINNTEIKVLQLGIKYLSLHMLTVLGNSSGGGFVTGEKVDQVEIKYADTSSADWYSNSVWGKLYQELVSKYSNSRPFPLKVEY